jgi:hypothetical protein
MAAGELHLAKPQPAIATEQPTGCRAILRVHKDAALFQLSDASYRCRPASCSAA